MEETERREAGEEKRAGKSAKRLLTAVLLLLLIGGGVMTAVNWDIWFPGGSQVEEGGEDWTGKKEVYEGKKNIDSISIPGFDVLNIRAGAKEQKVNFYNPPQNTCYIRMTMKLSDGTVLWESKMIPPGKGMYSLTLNRTLKEGTYEDSVLHYDCFEMNDDLTPLNGSDVVFKLNAIK